MKRDLFNTQASALCNSPRLRCDYIFFKHRKEFRMELGLINYKKEQKREADKGTTPN